MVAGRISSLVLKITERCNLNCSYCYMYQHADTSFEPRPKAMSDAVYDQLLGRIREYCDVQAPHRMSLCFHGGEPTLVGAERLGQLAARARVVLGDRLGGLSMQTNATLLDPEWVEVLRRHQIHVGVSLNGPPEVHDAVRVDHAGRGSQSATLRGLRLLREGQLDPGVLCVINPGVSGASIYRYFRSIGITRMNFLLPDVSHDRKERFYGRFGPTPVADYLIPIFNAWLDENDPAVRVQPLRDLIQQLLGGPSGRDDFGNPLMSYLIVETDGTIHALDALRVCDDGIAESSLNVFDHGFDDLHRGLPIVYCAVHEGFPLPAAFHACPEQAICGGGYLPHRYARATGFDNPSVWCADILKLLSAIRARLIIEMGTDSLRDVPPAA